ncbi:MAG: hypothetical protein WC424_05345 [Bacilli bacterium]
MRQNDSSLPHLKLGVRKTSQGCVIFAKGAMLYQNRSTNTY